MLLEPVFLQGVQRHRRLQHILEIHEAKQVLPPSRCALLYQPNGLKTRKGTEDV
jgi:hypothetical protein